MNKFTGHEAYVLSEALDLYVEEMNQDILKLEGEGKTPIFTTTYFPAIAKDMKWKIQQNTVKQKEPNSNL